MKEWFGTACVVLALPLVQGVAGAKLQREDHGARWARVSDRGQIELLIDGMAAGSGTPMAWLPGASILVRGTGAAATLPSVGRVEFEKQNGVWRVAGEAAVPAPAPVRSLPRTGGMSVGATFTAEPVSREFSIDRLSRGVTQARLQRALFSTPEKTASYYRVRYTSTAPYVHATFVQFVTDPGWDRVVYGNLNRWIKSLPVAGPSAIAVDADGRVFLGESRNRSIMVYRLTGEGADIVLQPVFRIPGVEAADIAVDDRGTPLDTEDDLLYVADATHHRLLLYRVGAGSALPAGSWDGFESPTAVAVGRRNGASSGLVYVIDRVGKRLRAFEPRDGALVPYASYQGEYSRYFKSLKADHFGGIYVVDNTRNELLKFSSSLELLDTAGEFDSPAALEIPFGRIEIDGEPALWAGFDQLFAVERWSGEGGGQRRRLGVRLKEIGFALEAGQSRLENTFVLTDVANVSVRVLNASGGVVRTLASSWMNAGGRVLVWDRRDDRGRLVAPGAYRFEIRAESPYRDEPVISTTGLTLPMYYHEDCGSVRVEDDPHLVQGTPVRWGALSQETANQHGEAVVYRFRGLNAGGTYQVEAEYGAGDGADRVQLLTCNGEQLGEPLRVGTRPERTGIQAIPPRLVTGSELVIAVERRSGPNASVTQLWLREAGAAFDVQQLDPSLPSAYALEQNYPNPFNPSTVIRFTLPEPALATVRVYNIAGQEVATLMNERRQAGVHEVVFESRGEGRNLASGVYFYRLTAGDFTATRKLVLLK